MENDLKVIENNKKRGLTIPLWMSFVLLFLLSLFITSFELYIQKGKFTVTLVNIITQPLLIFLNVFPVLALSVILFVLLKNVFFASGISGLIFSLMAYVNLLKVECRQDTFVPSDIALIREALDAVNDYQLDLHIIVLIEIAVFCAAMVALGVFIKSRGLKNLVKIIVIVAIIAAFIVSMFTVYSSYAIYSSFKTPDIYNIPDVFDHLGFNYCFLYNYNLYPVDKPDGYSSSEVEKWENEYLSKENSQSEKPNVIFVMCEAFSDLSK